MITTINVGVDCGSWYNKTLVARRVYHKHCWRSQIWPSLPNPNTSFRRFHRFHCSYYPPDKSHNRRDDPHRDSHNMLGHQCRGVSPRNHHSRENLARQSHRCNPRRFGHYVTASQNFLVCHQSWDKWYRVDWLGMVLEGEWLK